jgi:secondary thiamine-phosphate synthase enzyme
MKISQEILSIRTRPHGFVDLTSQVNETVHRSGIQTGVCHVFLQHTSASLLVQENADPAVLRDLERFFRDLVPERFPWEHTTEGPDDMPAHVRTALTKTSETLPLSKGILALGTWQALYLWEHRAHSHDRQVLLTILGEA